MIQALERRMSRSRDEAAELFMRLLPDSQISDLGIFFVRDVYFGCLLDSEFYNCDVFLLDGTVAGFITYTTDDKKLFAGLKIRHFFEIFVSCIKGFLFHPVKVTRGVYKYLTLAALGKSEPCSEVHAELMSFAVSKEMQSRSGVKISNALYRSALEKLDRIGIMQVKSVALSGNLMARMLNAYFKMKPVYTGPINSRGSESYAVFIGNVADSLNKAGI